MRSTDWCIPMQNGPSVGDAEAILDVLLGWGDIGTFYKPVTSKTVLTAPPPDAPTCKA